MKIKCVAARSYDGKLIEGKEYEVFDMCDGIFSGDYYITVIGESGKKVSGHFWRFDISKEQVKEFIANNNNNKLEIEK